MLETKKTLSIVVTFLSLVTFQFGGTPVHAYDMYCILLLCIFDMQVCVLYFLVLFIVDL